MRYAAGVNRYKTFAGKGKSQWTECPRWRLSVCDSRPDRALLPNLRSLREILRILLSLRVEIKGLAGGLRPNWACSADHRHFLLRRVGL